MSLPYVVYYHSFTDDALDGWTWAKWPGIPSEEDREAIKSRYQARFSRKRLAWYIKQYVPCRAACACPGPGA
jgi:hypothetical protein